MGLLTGSPAAVAGVGVAELLGGLLVGAMGGVVADRGEPRSIMLVCDALRSLALVLLALVPAAVAPPAAFVVAFGVAAAGGFFGPARTVLLAAIVPGEQIPRAQASVQAAQSVALIAGPAVGSALLLLLGPRACALADGLSFALSAAALLLVTPVEMRSSHPAPHAPVGRHGLWHELTAGVRLVAGSESLLPLALAEGAMGLVGWTWYAVDPFFVRRSLHLSPQHVGFLWTAAGIGGLLVTILLARRGSRRDQANVLLAGLALRGGALLAYASAIAYGPALVFATLGGVGDSLVITALASLTILRAPPGTLGRVSATVEASGQAAALVALVFLALWGQVLTPSRVLLLCGALLSATCLALWWRPFRR